MSQTEDQDTQNGTTELTDEQSEKLFDEGFAFGEQAEDDGVAPKAPQESLPEEAPRDRQPKQAEASMTAETSPVYTSYAAQSPQAMPSHAVPHGASSSFDSQPSPTTVKTVEVPEEIADEWESLKKLNPDAAALALEDSPEGSSVRARLEQYGAELAQDRAERVLWQRQQEQQRRKEELDQAEKAREAHNTAFVATMQRDHPDYIVMLQDPSRRAEAAQYQRDVFGWIASKPYSEAARLMETAQSGRDPVQVSALLSQYERERGGKSKSPDPTGALAVPGRGAPVAPAGIGDKDDFDAGWNSNPSK